MIEIDRLGLTSDGHVAVLHDTTVNRTTSGRGTLSFDHVGEKPPLSTRDPGSRGSSLRSA
jgi:glycerophosphoryl diester phosphodiesterase